MQTFDPYDIRGSVAATTVDALEQDPVYSQALALAASVQALHSEVSDRPRYAPLFDQVCRASSSIALNFAQGFAKLKGHTGSDWLVSRGEAYELYAGLSLLPDAFRALKPQLKELIELLNERIVGLPERHERPAWKN